jgi:hypothetical protein
MVEFDIVAPILIGSFAGLIMSLLFIKYGSSKNYSIIIFGKDSNTIISGLLLFGLFLAVAVLSSISFLVFDVEYILDEPINFIIELVSITLLPILPFLLMYILRNNNISQKNIVELFLIGTKLAVFHILFQLAGYYRYYFD